MKKVDLSKFDNSWYKAGSIIKRFLWYISNFIFFKTLIPYPYKLKVFILKFFGAKVGESVVIKPDVNIKFPWFLEIGDNVWIGESVWIDNLTWVKIGNNVCISQGAYICTGNHNYKKESFDLIVKPVIIEDGVWIGAKSVVCPGITIASHSILVAGGVLTKNTQPYSIYKGNPAEFIRKREIS
jgi:putative colanic acid biosynthesis acetyltransferase WcaF